MEMTDQTISLEYDLHARTGTEESKQNGVILARVTGLESDGTPLIQYNSPFSRGSVAAFSTVAISKVDIGRTIAVQFLQGNPKKPIILGFLLNANDSASQKPIEVVKDNERLEFKADREIVLSCGDASIRLTKAGKIIIKGRHLTSRSSGPNKIRGASIEIN